MNTETAGQDGATEAKTADGAGETAGERLARDSLYKLPLKMIPLEVSGIKRCALVKNVHLDTMLELFQDDDAGSGQIPIEKLPSVFQVDEDALSRDTGKLHRLSNLTSFDVYTLRIELRRLDIRVDETEYLTLSNDKKEELTAYMKDFTRPLIKFVYGSDQALEGTDDIIALIRRPNRDEAISNLKKFSEKLNVELYEIPNFLEEYGDIFLSLAYFKQCLDVVVPDIYDYLQWQNEVTDNFMFKRDLSLKAQIEKIDKDLNYITSSLTGRFEVFDRKSKTFWDDINGNTFRDVRDLIQSHHSTVGGVLCGLTVKMLLWRKRFSSNSGSPQRRVEFIKSEIAPGLSRVKALEESGRR